jgi:hypothetical protein
MCHFGYVKYRCGCVRCACDTYCSKIRKKRKNPETKNARCAHTPENSELIKTMKVDCYRCIAKAAGQEREREEDEVDEQ